MRDETEGQSQMKYYSKHIGDFATATRLLSLMERGAYNELMDYYYATEKPLPADLDALCRIAGAFSEQERTAVDKVSRQFFEKVDGQLFQAKIEEQILSYNEESEKNRMNGGKGGRPPKPKENPVGNPEGYVSDTHRQTQKKANPVTSNHISKPNGLDKGKKPATPSFALPDWVPDDTWSDFVAMRKQMRKPMGEAAIRLAVRTLEDLRGKGNDPKLVIEQSIMRGWTGLFPLRSDFAKTAAAKPSRHSGFDQIDYREGVNNDGSF
ncbi:hypothetical protein WI75_08690 [Burkholderia ubonensis]|nr:hypothetical protein WI75_08690 [Burkholderia ubonensis]